MKNAQNNNEIYDYDDMLSLISYNQNEDQYTIKQNSSNAKLMPLIYLIISNMTLIITYLIFHF